MKPAAADAMTAYGLVALLLAATLGEGGGHAVSMMGWHAALVLLVLYVLVTAAPPRSGLPRSLLVPASLFLLLFAVGAMRAAYAYAALLVAIELACCIAVFWIATRDGGRLLHRLATPLQLAAAVHALYVGLQWAGADAARPAGTFLNPNHLSLWLVAVTLFALGSLRPGDGRTRVLFRIVLALPAALAIVLAGSRGALLALAVGSIWLLWVRRRMIPPVTRLVLVAALIVIVGGVGGRQLTRIGQHDPFRYHRGHIWRASAAMVAEQPLWGTGPGQFADVAANFRFADGDGPLQYDRAFANTHSDWVRLPVEFGLPAALAALAALSLAAVAIVRRRRRGQLEPGADGALAALIAIGTQALVDNPSTWPSVYLLASAVAGLVLSRRQDGLRRLQPGARLALGCALCLTFLVADVAPFMAWRSVRGLQRGTQDDAGLARLQRAVGWNPLQPDYRLRMAEHLSADAASWGIERYAEAREAAEHAVRLHPRSARYRRGVASVEARACRSLFVDVACRRRTATAFRAAEQLAPFDPFLPAARAAFLIDMGDPTAARRAAERALGLEPRAVLPLLLLADALLSADSVGDRERAAALLAEARERAVRWSSWDQGLYGARMLRPDPAVFDRLERKLRRRE